MNEELKRQFEEADRLFKLTNPATKTSMFGVIQRIGIMLAIVASVLGLFGKFC